MKKILIVDDEEDIRTFLKLHLEDKGFEVDSAGNGDEGYKKLKKFKPDLAILDIIMPYKSGIKLLERMRINDKYKKFPVIILSAVVRYREQFEEQFDILDPPVAFMDKPVDLDKLVHMINNMLN